MLLALSAGLPCAEGRIFTNKKGKAIDAEMVGASSTHVRLKKDGRVFNVPIDSLSEADQAFIRTELKEIRHRMTLQKRIAAIRNAGLPKKEEMGAEDGQEGEAAEATFDATNTDFISGPDEPAKKPDQPEKPRPPAEAKPPAKKPPPKKPVRDPDNPGLPGKVVTEKFEPEEDIEVRYYIYLPKDFKRGGKPPALFQLASGSHHQRNYMDAYLKAMDQNGCVLVMPVYEREPKLEMVETDRAVFKEVITKLGIDEDRIFMSGFSSSADRILKGTEYPDVEPAGILSCDAGLAMTRAKLDKKTVLFMACGAGSKRRYDVAYTFDSLLKGKDHRMRFFMGSNTWPPEETITEGVTWLNVCSLRKVSTRDAALVAERKALAARLHEQIKEEKETAPDKAYEKALMLQELSADPSIARVAAPLVRELEKKAEIKLYVEARKELERLVEKYLGEDPRKVNMKEVDKSAKRAAERLAEKYKDTSLAPILSRVGDMPL